MVSMQLLSLIRVIFLYGKPLHTGNEKKNLWRRRKHWKTNVSFQQRDIGLFDDGHGIDDSGHVHFGTDVSAHRADPGFFDKLSAVLQYHSFGKEKSNHQLFHLFADRMCRRTCVLRIYRRSGQTGGTHGGVFDWIFISHMDRRNLCGKIHGKTAVVCRWEWYWEPFVSMPLVPYGILF